MPPFQNVTRGGLGFANIPRAALAKALRIEIDFDTSPLIVARNFATLGANIRSFKEPLQRSIQEVIAPSLQRNFDEGGRPEAWIPLSDLTIAHQKHGQPRKGGPLVRTGRLRRTAGQLNIWTIDGPGGLAYISSLPSHSWYGVIHQGGYDVGGWNEIPARPWAVLQENDLGDIEAVFSSWIEGKINAHL